MKSPEQPGLNINSAPRLASGVSRRFTRDATAPSADGNSPSQSADGNTPSQSADGNTPSTGDGTRGRKSRVASREQLCMLRPAHMQFSSRSPNIRIAIRSGIAARRRLTLRESQPTRAALLLSAAEPQPPEAALPRLEAEPLLQVEALYKGRRPRLRPERQRPRRLSSRSQ